MHADADDREAVARADLLDDADAELDGHLRVGGLDQQGIADRLHLLAHVLRKQTAHLVAEVGGDVGGVLVAVHLGQGGEPGEVGEEERQVLLAFRPRCSTRLSAHRSIVDRFPRAGETASP